MEPKETDTPHCLVLLAPCPSKTVLRYFLDPKRGAANKEMRNFMRKMTEKVLMISREYERKIG